MSWIATVDAGTPLEAVLNHRPDLAARYRAFYRSIFTDGLVPRRTLELCRLRIAAIHDCAAEAVVRDTAVSLGEAELAALQAGACDGFSSAERAALALAELIPFAHHSISDAQMAAVRDDLGDAGCVALVTALAFFDVSCRMRLTLDIDAEPAHLSNPPLRHGALV